MPALLPLSLPVLAGIPLAHTAALPNQHPLEKRACPTSNPSATSLALPANVPSGAPTAPGDFVGFGFETAFLPNYAVGNFSQNLVNSVAKRIPGPITIRIGGTSGDRFEFDPNQEEIKVCIDGDCPVGSSASYILGPSYFDAFAAFSDQKFSFQARQAPELNLTATLAYVQRAFEVLGVERTAAIALGNEPDLYPGQYDVTYGAGDYVSGALELEQQIIEALGLQGDEQKIFEVADLAGAGGQGFTMYVASLTLCFSRRGALTPSDRTQCRHLRRRSQWQRLI